MNKNKKFKFSLVELILLLGSSLFLGILTVILTEKILKGEPYFETTCIAAGILLVILTIIVRNRIKVIEIKTEI